MTDIATLAFRIDALELKQAQKDLDSFGKESEKTGRKTKEFGSTAANALKAVAVAASAAAVAGRALASAQTYVTMNNSLRAIGLSGDQAAAALEQVAGVAQRTRSPLEATASLYQRISIAGRDLGASSADVLRFTENIGLGLAQTGGSAAAASGALTQLSQAMAGGVVRAEEFNSILEGAFPIAQAAANGIDGAAGSVGRLRNMIVEGDVSSRQFFDAILSQTDALEAAFANTVPTIGQALTSLNNNFIMLSGSMDATLGVSSAIANGILFLSDNLERLATYAAVAAVAIGVTYGGAAAIAAARTLTLSGALTFLRGAIIRTGLGALVIAAGELTFQFMRVVKATGSFGDALGLLSDVAAEVFGRIGMAFDVIPLAVSAGANKMAAVFFDALRSMMIGFQDMINAVVGGLNDTFGTSLSYARGMGDGLYDMANAASAAANAASGAGNAILDAVTAPLESVARLREVVTNMPAEFDAVGGSVSGASAALDEVGGGSGSADKAAKSMADAAAEAKKLADEIKQLEYDADPLLKYNDALEHLGELSAAGLSDGAYTKAVQELNDELADSYPLVNDVADAFGDFVAGGLRDFDSFVDSILGSFKSMLAEMIATAARNQIMISMGIGGGGIGSSIGGMGGALGGVASSFMGGASSVISGLASGGLSGGIGAIGTSLAGATSGLAGLAAAAGAVALPLAAAYGAFKLITGSVKTVDSGFRMIADGSELLTKAYKDEERSRFGGLSKSNKTSYSVIDDSPFAAAYGAIYDGVTELAGAFNIGAGVLEKYTKTLHVSTKGMSEAEAQAAVVAKMQETQNDLAQIALGRLGGAGVDSRALFQREGETSSDTLARLVKSLQTANDSLELLGGTLLPLGKNGALAAVAMADAFGGVEQMAAGVTDYYNNFYSAEEKLRDLRKEFVDQTNALDVGYVPVLADNFRAKVDALLADGETEAAAALIALSPMVTSMATYREQLEATTDAVVDAADKLNDTSRRSSLYEQYLGLIGDEERLRARTIATMTNGEARWQQAIWDLEDEADAQAALADAASAAAKAIQDAVDALSSSDFASMFDFQRAQALASQGLSYTTASTNGSAFVPSSVTTDDATDNVVVQLRTLNDRMERMETETRQYRLKDLQQGKKTSDTLQRWDNDGLPAERTA